MILKILQRNLNSAFTHKNYQHFNYFQQQKCFWQWFYILFNKIDYDRLKKYGPDRSCAEWVLKNGGAVRFQIQNDLIKDYYDLAPESSDLVRDHLIEIYADGISLHSYGFDHLKDCNQLSKVTFISCKYIYNEGLEKLHLYLKNSLKYLEIKSCPSITDKGVLSLVELRNLNKLTLHNLPGVSDKEKCETIIKTRLQNTNEDGLKFCINLWALLTGRRYVVLIQKISSK